MNAPAYTLTNESITIIWDGKPHTVQKGAPQFLPLRMAILNEDWGAIPKHLTVAKSLSEWAKGKFTVQGETISYAGERLPSDINQRILQMAGKGEDPMPVFLFWERLQKNPSSRSVKQLWPFLLHQGIPLTKDGCFLAYKGINQNYTDKHSGTVDNKPGVINEMPRNKISDDPNEACHFGYHVGALEYAQTFAPGGRMVICKVDPADVVCVPYDESQRKMRVCKYEVIGNHNGCHLPDTVCAEGSTAGTQNDDDNPFVCEDCGNDHDDCTCEDYDEDDEDSETEDDKQERLEERGKISDLMAKEADEGLMPVKSQLDGSALAAGDVDRLGSGSKTVEEKRKAAKGFSKYDKMEMEGLMECSIEELRQYATHGLQIIGASKIPGGKVALISRILEIRA
jgi:hypothetical protein